DREVSRRTLPGGENAVVGGIVRACDGDSGNVERQTHDEAIAAARSIGFVAGVNQWICPKSDVDLVGIENGGGSADETAGDADGLLGDGARGRKARWIVAAVRRAAEACVVVVFARRAKEAYAGVGIGV